MNQTTKKVQVLNGFKGDSAYVTALRNGFEGTEQEWLASLVGPQGPKGDAFTYDDFTPEQIENLKPTEDIKKLEARITNLENKALSFKTDTDVAYSKDVPENTLPYAAISKIGGRTYKCNNLLNIASSGEETKNGLTLTFNGDGTFTINGTSTAETTFYYRTAFALPTGDFFLKTNASEMGWNSYWGGFSNEHTAKEDWDVGAGVKITSESNNFTLFVKVLSGKTLNSVVFKPMINTGDTALPYEPYFEGLRDGKVTQVKSVDVNIFSPTKDYGWQCDSPTISEDGKYTFTRNASGGVCYFQTKPIYLEAGKTYTLRASYTGVSHIYFVKQSDDSIVTTLYGLTKFTPTGSGNYFFRPYMTGTNIGDTASVYLWINEGDVDLPYSPYTEHTLTIPEAVQSLEGYGLGVNNTYYNYIDFEDKKFNRVVGKVDLSTLIWSYSEADKRFYTTAIQFKNVDNNIKPNLICANYTGVSFNDFYSKPDVDKTISTTGQYLFIRDLSYTDVSTFVSTLKGVSLVYALATPTAEDISNLITDDNLIGVEGGGTLTFVNEYGYAVPNEVFYQLRGVTV